MTLTKNTQYTDKAIYNTGTLTYTGKKKTKNSGYNTHETYYYFTYNDKYSGTSKKWIKESYVNDYLSEAL
jgi:hypothetical protein